GWRGRSDRQRQRTGYEASAPSVDTRNGTGNKARVEPIQIFWMRVLFGRRIGIPRHRPKRYWGQLVRARRMQVHFLTVSDTMQQERPAHPGSEWRQRRGVKGEDEL